MNHVVVAHYEACETARAGVPGVDHPMARRMSPIQKVSLGALSQFARREPKAFARLFDELQAPLFFASHFGELSSIVKEAEDIHANSLPVSPLAFQHSVFNAAAGYASIVFKNNIPSVCISSGFLSFEKALLLAWKRVSQGHLSAACVVSAHEATRRSDAALGSAELFVLCAEEVAPLRTGFALEEVRYGEAETPPRGIPFEEHREERLSPCPVHLSTRTSDFARCLTNLEGERVLSIWRRIS